jgi:hypothetical protein
MSTHGISLHLSSSAASLPAFAVILGTPTIGEAGSVPVLYLAIRVGPYSTTDPIQR